MTWAATIGFVVLLAGFAGALGHIAESRQSSLRRNEREVIGRVAYALFLVAVAILALRGVASLVAYLQAV